MMTNRYRRRRKPRIAQGDLARAIRHPIDRIHPDILGPDHPHPVLSVAKEYARRSARRSPWPASSATSPAAPDLPLIRQYLPEGMDLSEFNGRGRRVLGDRSPAKRFVD